MQEAGDEISDEKHHQEMMAIAAFCNSQKPHVQALLDNVARVYGKAGTLIDTRGAIPRLIAFCSKRAFRLDPPEDCIWLRSSTSSSSATQCCSV
jgi:hypothetical protein